MQTLQRMESVASGDELGKQVGAGYSEFPSSLSGPARTGTAKATQGPQGETTLLPHPLSQRKWPEPSCLCLVRIM